MKADLPLALDKHLCKAQFYTGTVLCTALSQANILTLKPGLHHRIMNNFRMRFLRPAFCCKQSHYSVYTKPIEGSQLLVFHTFSKLCSLPCTSFS